MQMHDGGHAHASPPEQSNDSQDARSRVVSPEGYLQCMPHMHGCDGAFAARIRVVKDLC